jgi:hypothetical protein
MFLGMVLAIAAGLGTAFLLNAADSTIRGSADVVTLAGAEPFAHIPVIRSQSELRRQRTMDFALAAGMALFAVVLLIFAA